MNWLYIWGRNSTIQIKLKWLDLFFTSGQWIVTSLVLDVCCVTLVFIYCKAVCRSSVSPASDLASVRQPEPPDVYCTSPSTKQNPTKSLPWYPEVSLMSKTLCVCVGLTSSIIMSTGLTLCGLILLTNLRICSKVGRWTGLWARHRRISW